MAKWSPVLQNIIELAQKRPQDSALQAIFDLDSTLFDISHRIIKIIHSFAKLPDVEKEFPEASVALLKIQAQTSDWGVRKTLGRAGFAFPSEEFGKRLVEYWKRYFFSGNFLEHDRPYPRAVEYVKALHKAGARIIYLTGRDIPRMYKDTVKSMEHWWFPIQDRANLVLKPDTTMSDSEFKRNFFSKIDRQFDEVWFFENEPTNIQLVLKHYPHIKIVFVATVHSGKTTEPGQHIPRIKGFEFADS